MIRNPHISKLPYPPEVLGHVRIEADPQTVAGSMATVRITYTAGKFGIDDQGSLRFLLRFASDAGRPQFDRPGAPNYCTAIASNGTKLLLEYHPRGAFRPWFKSIRVNVMREALREGDTLTLVLGDRSQGGAGWRTSTMREERFEVRVQVDPFGTVVYGDVAGSAAIDLVPGAPHVWKAVLPTLRRVGEPFELCVRADDVCGNPVARLAGVLTFDADGAIDGLPARVEADGQATVRIGGLKATAPRHAAGPRARRRRRRARRVEPARRRRRSRAVDLVGRLPRAERRDHRHQQRARLLRVRARPGVLRFRRPPGQRLPDLRRVLGRAEPALRRVPCAGPLRHDARLRVLAGHAPRRRPQHLLLRRRPADPAQLARAGRGPVRRRDRLQPRARPVQGAAPRRRARAGVRPRRRPLCRPARRPRRRDRALGRSPFVVGHVRVAAVRRVRARLPRRRRLQLRRPQGPARREPSGRLDLRRLRRPELPLPRRPEPRCDLALHAGAPPLRHDRRPPPSGGRCRVRRRRVPLRGRPAPRCGRGARTGAARDDGRHRARRAAAGRRSASSSTPPRRSSASTCAAARARSRRSGRTHRPISAGASA